jgi:hypothetical protein
MLEPARAGFAGLLLVTACGDWPRSAHLPDPGPLLPAGAHPRSSVPLVWTPASVEGADQPPGTPLAQLPEGQGVLVEGSLDGTGWNAVATAAAVIGEACGTSGTRAPFPGDYTGEVEVFRLRVDTTSTVCLRAVAGDTATSFDLTLRPLDACGVPGPALSEEGASSPVGADRLGPAVDVMATLGAGDWAIVYAGYLPDRSSALPFRLGVSRPAPMGAGAPVDDTGEPAVPSGPAGDILCPLLPGEVAP